MNHSKTCTGCGQTKDNSSFSTSKLGKFGTRSKCKECCSQQSRDYRSRNREKVLASMKAYREANPEKIKALNEKFRKDNPDYAKEYHAKHRKTELLRSKRKYWSNTTKEALRKRTARANNPEAFRERYRTYAENNKEMISAKSQRRRASIANNKTFLISKKELLLMYSSDCFYCGDLASTLDHVIPISRGGSHGIGNLVPACTHCNFSKAARTIMEWRIWKLRLGL